MRAVDFVKQHYSSAAVEKKGLNSFFIHAWTTVANRRERKMLGFGRSEEAAWLDAERYVLEQLDG